MDKESSYNLRVAINGIVIYVLMIYFHGQNKIKTKNLTLTFTILGFWFIYMTYRYFSIKFLKKERKFKQDYIVLGVAVLNSVLYILGALGTYFKLIGN